MNKEITQNDLQPVDYDPFAGLEIIRAVQATEPQLEMWVSSILGGRDANCSYNESVSLELNGSLNYDAMNSALHDLLERHDALRASFSADGSQMCIYKEISLSINFVDLSKQDANQQRSYITEFAKTDAETPFDLLNGPLLRVALFKINEQKHYLTISAHHIICDGWSFGVVMQDLSILYSAKIKGVIPDLPPAAQFSDYAIAERELAQSDEYKKIEQYWVDQYKENVPVLDIPTDYPRPLERTYKSHRDDYTLSRESVNAIKKMGAKVGCSFITTLIASFEVYLHRITGQRDIILGIPAAGQSITDNFSLIGHCVNLLPLRSNPDGNVSFVDYLKQRKPRILNDYEHQQVTFGSLLKKINIARDASRVPMVPVVFNIDMSLDDGVAFEGLTHELFNNPREFESFEIFVNAMGSEQSFVLEWSYNVHLFKPESIRRMMDEFKSLLQAVSDNPAIKIKDIPLRPFNETYSKLKAWNDTATNYPQQKTFNDLFLDAANKYPEKIALRFGDQFFSYSDLNELSNQFAGFLAKQNIKTGDVVAIAVDRSPEMVIALLSAMKSGATYLPIDPSFAEKEIDHMLQDSSAKLFIISKKYKNRFQSSVTELLIEDIWQQLPSFPKSDFHSDVNGDHLAYILYTSVSASNSKAVEIEHHSLVNLLLSMQKKPGIQQNDRLLAIANVSFDIAALELYLPLIAGAELVLADQQSSKDGRKLFNIIESQSITIMQATASIWRIIMQQGWEKKIPLKVLCGREALPKDLAEKLLLRCDSLWNMYGLTETTIWSTVKQITANSDIITIGKPIDNTQIFILDNYFQLLPEDSIGEIYIGGDGIGRDYLNKPELTGEKFITNPFSEFSSERLYKTGDLGKFISNGEVQCLGKINEQVKIRGFRIDLGEIEYVLNNQEDVTQAIIIAYKEKSGDDRLVAYVVVKNAKKILNSTEKWKEELKKSIPFYMVPNDFIVLSEFPLTENGKIDQKALPPPNPIADVNMETAPRNASEKLIAEIWSELLGVKTLSIYDDFFKLGGHSLIAVQAMALLEKKTGKRLPLSSLLEAPTVEKLSNFLVNGKKPAYDSLVPLKPTGNKTPLYIVHGFGMNVLLFNNLVSYMDPQQPVYALQAIGLSTGKTDDSPNTMEEIAKYYVNEIVAQNPTGPYALAGYSLGGIIAFEMAKQLKAMGKEIKMLAILDMYADSSNYFDPFLLNITKKFRRQFPKIVFVFRSLMKQPGQTILYQAQFVKNKFRRLLGMKEIHEDEELLYDSVLTEKYNYAYVHYRMTPYNDMIDLFKVKTRLYYLDDLIYLGWKQFAEKGLNVYEITGDHKTFLYPPYDKEFAQTLQKILDERDSAREIAKSTSSERAMLKVV